MFQNDFVRMDSNAGIGLRQYPHFTRERRVEVRHFVSGDALTFSNEELLQILAFGRKAGFFPSSDTEPTPAGSEGVQAGAQRSPKGCLDAEGTVGHCYVQLTAWRSMMLPADSTTWEIEAGECSWRFVPNTSESGGSSCV